ncbi:hypothetical protein ABIB25_002015 [Nakamurella sp. UYEF19]|uniref:hypothetical protein n=1 Tax=Nakamurella sp. UYEF19 TaxID=1756392 RepID=UPI003393455A
MPDTDDLRLLAEIINNGSIGLPQAAWNARMSQTEAATRFVTMAERGMPLRLVAEGDRQLLWRIAQAGPATGGFPLPGAAPTPEPAPPAAPVAPVAPEPTPQPPTPAPDLSSGQIPVGAQTGSQATWAAPEPAPPAAPAPPVPVESQPVQQIPLPPMSPPSMSPQPMAPPSMSPPPMAPPPVVLPPASAVPPHEQAIAGAVPLGQPPFGASDTLVEPPAAPPTPPVEPATTTAPPGEAPPAESASPAEAVPGGPSTWGLPGTSAWVRSDEPEMTQSYPPPSRDDDELEGTSSQDTTPPAPITSGSPVVTPLPPLFPPSVLADFTPPASHLDLTPTPAPAEPAPPQPAPSEPAAAEPTPAAAAEVREFPPTPTESAPPAASPTSRVMVSGQPTQSIVGLFGEHLDVSLMGIIDPADAILTSVGYRLEAGERALLVQTSIGNRGPIDYESLPDLYLVLVGSAGDILPKAAMAVGGYPAHRVGVAANSLVSGWTVFLVPAATEVTELRWSVRPDLANRTVTWGFGPA